MVYSLDLDITPGGVPQIVKLSQYDKTIPEIQAVLWNGPSGYTIPTGATVWVAGTKPDKTGFEYQCTYSGSTVTIDITEQMTAVAGRVPVEVIVETATGRKGSANFFLDVEPAALADDTVISDTDIPIIQQIPEILAECEDYADLAHKWATFGNDSETPSSTNNALYWAQKSQEYAVGALHWKSSIPFANIPTTGMTVGDMYNITDAFTTDARFDEGAGVKCSAGTNIVWDANGKWDILISSTNAADINFDNTGTDLTATNVQNAITEINTSLSDKQPKTMSQTIAGETTVEGCLSTLNSNLTVNTVTVTSQSGHVTMMLNNTIVQGRTVHLVASASSDETGGRTESDGWLQIQSAYRPNSNRAIGCVIIKPDGTTAIGSAVVGTDGYIKQNVSSTAQYVLFMGTYQYNS